MTLLTFWARIVVLVLATRLSSTSGSLYPTHPISNTVFTAGQPCTVTWIEDGRRPLLSSLGGLKMDLYAGNNTYLTTVGININPLSLSSTIFIPLTIPANYHFYTLRFHPTDHPKTIYTADFIIIPSPHSLRPPHSSSKTSATAKPTPSVNSRISGSRPSPLVPNLFVTPTPSPAPTTPGSRPKPKSAGLRTSTSWAWDAERMKFRFVFIVWPAFVGLSLAM